MIDQGDVVIIFGFLIRKIGKHKFCKECGGSFEPVSRRTIRTAKKGLAEHKGKRNKVLEETRPYSSNLTRG